MSNNATFVAYLRQFFISEIYPRCPINGDSNMDSCLNGIVDIDSNLNLKILFLPGYSYISAASTFPIRAPRLSSSF